MNSHVIKNIRLVTPDGIFPNSSIRIADGIITDVSTDTPLSAASVFDGDGLYLSAGFIDIHLHGGGGHDFMDGTPEAFRGALRTHMEHGTTSLVPTTVAATDEELRVLFDTARTVRYAPNAKELPEILGVHLEGPYIAPEMAGAQDPQYIRIPTDGKWEDILRCADKELLIWTVAPELPGASELCASLREKGIIVSAGHSNARYDDVVRAIRNGCTMCTHLYSGMSTIIREQGYRVPGLLEASLLHDEIAAEVIADGLHLPPSLLQLICKTKGYSRVVLITDAMRGAGMPDGEYMLGSLTKGQLVSVFDGIAHMPDGISFAGSVATTDRLVRVMTQQAGIPLPEVIRMITCNPAREIGVADRKGSVAPGMDADLVLFDDDIHVHTVYRAGVRTVG